MANEMYIANNSLDRHTIYGMESTIEPINQIRTLELRPAVSDDADIECYLRVVKLSPHRSYGDSSDSYDALSYTWGESRLGRTVTLNSRSGFAVTDNLFTALRRLRHRDKRCTLWVDALCINQEDLNERSLQVQRMGDVYRQARRVLIWLGDAEEPMKVDRSPFKTQCATNDNDEDEDHKMRTLVSALNSTTTQWWTRTWIIQELVLAQNPVACFGKYILSWQDLIFLRERMSVSMEKNLSTIPLGESQQFMTDVPPAKHTFGYYIRQYRDTSDFDDGLTGLDDLRSNRYRGASLREIASATAQSRATNLRDRVYGYLGLCPQFSPTLTVNYEHPIDQVFSEASFADYKTEKSLRAMLLARPGRTPIEGLPSWALDFSFDGVDDEVPVYSETVINNKDPHLPPSVAGEISLKDGYRNLRCTGLLLDRVQYVHPLPRSLMFPKETEEHLLPAALNNLPTCDAYVRVRTNLTRGLSDTQNKINQPDSTTRAALPAHAETLTSQFGVQTDPISNAFLWWLTEVAHITPDKNSIVNMYEWWRYYARYQDDSKSRKHGLPNEACFVTGCGFMARGLPDVSEGDFVAFLYGLEIPAILRSIRNKYEFKGLAWVNGISFGELDANVEQFGEDGTLANVTIDVV